MKYATLIRNGAVLSYYVQVVDNVASFGSIRRHAPTMPDAEAFAKTAHEAARREAQKPFSPVPVLPAWADLAPQHRDALKRAAKASLDKWFGDVSAVTDDFRAVVYEE